VAKTVRIDEETYQRLCEQAGELQVALKRSVSMDDTIRYLTGSLKAPNKISDLAGSWKVSEKELETLKKDLREGWKTWQY
jgi:predicted CopG family antitoxin